MRLLTLLATTVLALAAATVAPAHVTPTPRQAPAGSNTVVAFNVGHGCEGSSTRQLSVQVPVGVVGAKPRAKVGWKVTSSGARVISWSGGLLRDGTLGTFEIRVRLPRAAGRTLYFPVVQRCVSGVTRWIQIPTKGQPRPDRPAPGVLLTKPAGAG